MVENPFPGMNPYLEHWSGDVHNALVVYAGDQLQELMPNDLRARFDERVFMDSDSPAAAELTESFLRIIDTTAAGQTITVIEFVSPWHKSIGSGRRIYQRTRDQAIQHGINFVEIDLLRGGKPVTLADPQLLAPQDRAPYHAAVWRASEPDTIAIPLRPRDPDAHLDLQALINLCYTRGRYDDIDYTSPLEPPLNPDDQQWAAEQLKKLPA